MLVASMKGFSIYWLLLLSVLNCLKLVEDGIRPLEWFRRNAISPGLPKVFHSLILTEESLQEVIRLLNHSEIPFDWFYSDSCAEFMDYDRFRMIIKIIPRKHWQALIPMSCLAKLKFELSGWDFYIIGADHFLSRIDNVPILSLKGSSISFKYQDLLSSFTGDMIQECSWLTDSRLPDIFFRLQLHEVLHKRREPWSLFHHSCFFPSRFDRNQADRMKTLIFWLICEVTEEAFSKFTPQQQNRWILHLLLVLVRTDRIFGFGQMLLGPLAHYLIGLEPYLKLSHSWNMSFLVLYCCWTWINAKKPNPESLPVPSSVLPDLIDSHDESNFKSRWTLSLLELYNLLGYPSLWHESDSIKLAKESLKGATALEQSHWVEMYLSQPHDLPFLLDAISGCVMNSPELQSWLLAKLEAEKATTDRIDLLQLSVPVRARLKAARTRFFSIPGPGSSRLVSVYRRISGNNKSKTTKTLSFDLSDATNGFLTTIAAYTHSDVANGVNSVTLMTANRLSMFTFIMATIKLFQIPTSFVLDPKQEAWIFGQCKFNEEDLADRFEIIELPYSNEQVQSSRCQIIDRNKNIYPTRPVGSGSPILLRNDLMSRLNKSGESARQIFYPLLTHMELPNYQVYQ